MRKEYIYLLFFLTLILIFLIDPNLTRVLIGSVFVLILPGVLLCYLLFPQGLDSIERIAYGIGLSICVVVIDGLLLDKIWEISIIPIIVTLGAFDIILVIGIILRYYFKN